MSEETEKYLIDWLIRVEAKLDAKFEGLDARTRSLEQQASANSVKFGGIIAGCTVISQVAIKIFWG